MSGKHFTEIPWVVYKRKKIGDSYISNEVEEIARGLKYEDAIRMRERLTKRYTDYEEYKTLSLIYNYTSQEDFDECQKMYKCNPQLNLFD